jgi:hypothetical protein
MGRIEDLHCLEANDAGKLAAFGIASTDRLLLVAARKQGREDLAQETGIPEEKILRVVNLADLLRVKGVGAEYGHLLGEAGVHTLKQLARRSADRLFQDLVGLNRQGGLVRRMPSIVEVENWVDGAQAIDSMVHH